MKILGIYNPAYCEILGILNIEVNTRTPCGSTPRLKGFYHSHDGTWNDAWTYEGGIEGPVTIKECADKCLQDCVAIFWSCYREHFCFHYSNRSDIVDANKKFEWRYKAYIKYPGNRVLLKLAVMQ